MSARKIKTRRLLTEWRVTSKCAVIMWIEFSSGADRQDNHGSTGITPRRVVYAVRTAPPSVSPESLCLWVVVVERTTPPRGHTVSVHQARGTDSSIERPWRHSWWERDVTSRQTLRLTVAWLTYDISVFNYSSMAHGPADNNGWIGPTLIHSYRNHAAVNRLSTQILSFCY